MQKYQAICAYVSLRTFTVGMVLGLEFWICASKMAFSHRPFGAAGRLCSNTVTWFEIYYLTPLDSNNFWVLRLVLWICVTGTVWHSQCGCACSWSPDGGWLFKVRLSLMKFAWWLKFLHMDETVNGLLIVTCSDFCLCWYSCLWLFCIVAYLMRLLSTL